MVALVEGDVSSSELLLEGGWSSCFGCVSDVEAKPRNWGAFTFHNAGFTRDEDSGRAEVRPLQTTGGERVR